MCVAARADSSESPAFTAGVIPELSVSLAVVALLYGFVLDSLTIVGTMTVFSADRTMAA